MADEMKKPTDAFAEIAAQAAQYKATLDEFAENVRRSFPDLSAFQNNYFRQLGANTAVLGGLGGLAVSPDREKFDRELSVLKKKVADQARKLQDNESDAAKKDHQLAALAHSLQELQAKEQLHFLLNRVCDRAAEELLKTDTLRQKFLDDDQHQAFVMSVDIRRSTELMLKARSPEIFAKFITELCARLSQVVIDSYGVFDKFTGDGVLAFFPDFYSGKDAAHYVVSTADRCHEVFREHYRASRGAFTSVLTDVGLGIGIDYGAVRLVKVADGLTVVGIPVVYACRLSGAPPDLTLVNQPAYEEIRDRFGAHCFISETALEIKHEGKMLAYEIRQNDQQFDPALPDWLKNEGATPKSKA
jgi:class 3 adenylate cyclase